MMSWVVDWLVDVLGGLISFVLLADLWAHLFFWLGNLIISYCPLI
jgi:hypothetical protein